MKSTFGFMEPMKAEGTSAEAVEVLLGGQRAGFRGRFKASVQEGDEKPAVVFDAPNLIVNGAKMIMAKLLVESSAEYRLTLLQLGTMGHGGSILEPIPPQVTDATLTDPNPVVISLTSAAYQSENDRNPGNPDTMINTAVFTFVLEKAAGNGTGVKAYTEAGLFSTGGIMFSRETFPAIVKNATRRVTFTWSIYF